MDDDLFSVFDKPEHPQAFSTAAAPNGTEGEHSKTKKKRSPATPVDGPPAPAPSTKKTKLERAGPEASTSASVSGAPVLADEFETEAQRKINASGGLQGKVEDGAQVVLSHQVRQLSVHWRL
jgi:hypothetical protein